MPWSGTGSWVTGHAGQGSADWWVTWITGHKTWPIVSSDTGYDPSNRVIADDLEWPSEWPSTTRILSAVILKNTAYRSIRYTKISATKESQAFKYYSNVKRFTI